MDQLTVPPTRRDVAFERSQRVSRALQDAARKARLSVRGSRSWQGAGSRGRASKSFALLSALVVFALPTLGGAVYYGLLASDQYVTESQFAVRARQPEATDLLTKATGLPSLQQAQDALVVVDYIGSRALVETIDKELDLRTMYARPEVTFFDRFDAADPIEKLTRYWKKMVNVAVDTSGIVQVRLRAYRPDDALALGDAVLRHSEALINDMSMRLRRDAVTQAEQEVKRAEGRLSDLRDRVRQVRDQEGVLDPKKSADAVLLILSTVRAQRIRLEDEIRVQLRTLVPTAPQMQVLRARLDALNGQIAKLEGEMTATAGSAGSALSRSFTAYDKAVLDQQSAEKVYTLIAASLEKARMEAGRQQVFLETFVQPLLPQEAEFPRRLWNTFLVGLGSFTVWFLLNYVRSSIKG